MNEDLRKWFGKGPKGDWVRVGTDGKIKGDCARDEGEGKPKCMPRSKAHSMSKKDRASAARRKRAKDPTVDRPGTGNKPIMVKTDKKKNESLEEKNVPTKPALWSKMKARAKSKFDVYPSAYANGWAAKQYKAAGGGWKKASEEALPAPAKPVTDKEIARRQNISKTAKKNSPKRTFKTMRQRLEATYQGKKVPLNKPMAGDVKKSKVYVDPDGDGKAKKVNFGDKNMKIKKNIPARRKSFRARHNCDNPGPKDKARYWSCKAW